MGVTEDFNVKLPDEVIKKNRGADGMDSESDKDSPDADPDGPVGMSKRLGKLGAVRNLIENQKKGKKTGFIPGVDLKTDNQPPSSTGGKPAKWGLLKKHIEK